MITLDPYDVKIFTDRVEPGALDQLRGLMAIPAFAGCRVRVMPDVHAGAGCVIGFTGDLGEKVVPNIVGVDIGCGILVQPLGALRHVDGRALTAFIRAAIPSGATSATRATALCPSLWTLAASRPSGSSRSCAATASCTTSTASGGASAVSGEATTSSRWTATVGDGSTCLCTPAVATWASRWPASTRSWQ